MMRYSYCEGGPFPEGPQTDRGTHDVLCELLELHTCDDVMVGRTEVFLENKLTLLR